MDVTAAVSYRLCAESVAEIATSFYLCHSFVNLYIKLFSLLKYFDISRSPTVSQFFSSHRVHGTDAVATLSAISLRREHEGTVRTAWLLTVFTNKHDLTQTVEVAHYITEY
jgi:hypothetical protein